MNDSFRTPELDSLEEQIIKHNNNLMNEGNNAFYSFVDEQSDVVIHDPYYETSGRFSVDSLCNSINKSSSILLFSGFFLSSKNFAVLNDVANSNSLV